MKDGITTGGTENILLDAIETCFSVEKEFGDEGVDIVAKFDREKAARILNDFENKLAVGRG